MILGSAECTTNPEKILKFPASVQYSQQQEMNFSNCQLKRGTVQTPFKIIFGNEKNLKNTQRFPKTYSHLLLIQSLKKKPSRIDALSA